MSPRIRRDEENIPHFRIRQKPQTYAFELSQYGLDRGNIDGKCDMIAALMDEIPI